MKQLLTFHAVRCGKKRIACVFDNSGGSGILVLGVKMLRPKDATPMPTVNAAGIDAAPRLVWRKWKILKS